MTATDLIDLRTANRRPALEVAMIRSGDMSVCCTVRSLSETGAALDVGAHSDIPDRFTLIAFLTKKKIYSCTVVWRKKTRIGVSFR
jgi:hypothetical protein